MDIVASQKHGIYEDMIALALGTLMVALGVAIYSKATLLVGGMAGMALLVQYTSGVNFWIGFSLINLPFYLLGLKYLGWLFVLRYVCCRQPGFPLLPPHRGMDRLLAP